MTVHYKNITKTLQKHYKNGSTHTPYPPHTSRKAIFFITTQPKKTSQPKHRKLRAVDETLLYRCFFNKNKINVHAQTLLSIETIVS